MTDETRVARAAEAFERVAGAATALNEAIAAASAADVTVALDVLEPGTVPDINFPQALVQGAVTATDPLHFEATPLAGGAS